MAFEMVIRHSPTDSLAATWQTAQNTPALAIGLHSGRTSIILSDVSACHAKSAELRLARTVASR